MISAWPTYCGLIWLKVQVLQHFPCKTLLFRWSNISSSFVVIEKSFHFNESNRWYTFSDIACHRLRSLSTLLSGLVRINLTMSELALSATSRVSSLTSAAGWSTLLPSLMWVDLPLSKFYSKVRTRVWKKGYEGDWPPVPTRLSGVPSCLSPSCSGSC